MGASGWEYYVPYNADPLAVLAELHRRVLAERAYYWGNEELPRPGTLAELHRLYEDEGNDGLAADGTHSILDIYQVKPAGAPDEFGTIRPLSMQEAQAAFGTSTPARNQFEAVYQGGMGPLADVPRWSGRYTTLYDGDTRPVQIVVWGCSGD